MKRLVLSLIILAATSLLVSGCADKNSLEACQHETTLNLDQGNYDAVLASSCASQMQKGAAYFGLAGFDITNIINRFIDAGDTTNDLNLYMTAMISRVTDSTLNNLNLSSAEYSAVAPTSDVYKDAQFNLALVSVVKGLSVLKIISDADGLGTVDNSCDANGNGKADEVDAAACALFTSATTTTNCIDPNTQILLGTVDADIQNISLQGKSYNSYRGIIITVSGTGPTTPTCPTQYKKLLYSPAAGWSPAIITADICQEVAPDTARTWPCPIESDGQPLNVVGEFDTSMNTSISALNTAVATPTTVVNSIVEIKQGNCCKQPGEAWNIANPSSCTCSPDELAVYLTTN